MPPTSGLGLRRGSFALACLCVLGIVVFVGAGAPAADGAGGECPNAAIRGQQGSGFLPDCRAFEMVSPVQKAGNQAFVDGNGYPLYSRAGASGDSIIYYTTGAVSEAKRGVQAFTAGTRTPDGWTNISAIPGPEPGIPITVESQLPMGVQISADASHVAFLGGSFVTENPNTPQSSFGGYLTSPDGPLQWLNRPLTASATPRPGEVGLNNTTEIIGGSPDFGTLYFGYCGTITAADAPREGSLNPGFYVSEAGAVHTAGVLPDGSVDPDGAAPPTWNLPPCVQIKSVDDPSLLGNPVSEDGTRAQFVSPAWTVNPSRPSQLYQYRQGEPSVLISRSEITGEPAPSGIVTNLGSLAPASSDGKFVVFASMDRLTTDAPSDPETRKLYRFDADTGDLEYLNGLDSILTVANPTVKVNVLAVSSHGAVLASKETAAGAQILLWYGGEAHPVGIANNGENGSNPLNQVHFSADGETLVFISQFAFIGGVTNQPNGTYEIYRYVLGQAGLPECISCSPDASTPVGSAFLSHLGRGATFSQPFGGTTLNEDRNVSPDGRRVFFDTPDALVPTDTNGKRDVYEWADGRLSLITTGRSVRDSYIVDSSTSTDDVFIATAEGLVPEDKDESYDVYDARVDGGFAREDVRTCGGESCLGEIAGPPSQAPVASGASLGAGNVERKADKGKARARKLKSALRRCKAKPTKAQRRKCRAAAHKKYAKNPQAGRSSR